MSAAVVASLLPVLIAGCAASAPAPSTTRAQVPATEQVAPGDIPDRQAYVTQTGASGDWSIQVPEGWSQRSVAGGIGFTDKYNLITVTQRSTTASLTTASAEADAAPGLKAAHPALAVQGATAVTRKAGPAVEISYQADSAKDAVTGKVHRDAGKAYVFARGTREVVVDLTGAVGADNVDPWRTITNSFRWLR